MNLKSAITNNHLKIIFEKQDIWHSLDYPPDIDTDYANLSTKTLNYLFTLIEKHSAKSQYIHVPLHPQNLSKGVEDRRKERLKRKRRQERNARRRNTATPISWHERYQREFNDKLGKPSFK